MPPSLPPSRSASHLLVMLRVFRKTPKMDVTRLLSNLGIQFWFQETPSGHSSTPLGERGEVPPPQILCGISRLFGRSECKEGPREDWTHFGNDLFSTLIRGGGGAFLRGEGGRGEGVFGISHSASSRLLTRTFWVGIVLKSDSSDRSVDDLLIEPKLIRLVLSFHLLDGDTKG